MKKKNGAILSIAILFLASALPSISRADDLDTLLTQPPSASLTPEDAAHRIEMLRALAANHPDRADEIEAYLIPFVRAAQPPSAEPTPPAAPPPAKENPLLLIKGTDGTTTILRATSYRRQGAVVMAVGANGSHAVLQAITVQGELPWYSEKDLESGAVNLSELADRYDTFAKAMPAFRAALGAESARLRKMQKARADAADIKSDAARKELGDATSEVYKPGTNYTRAELAKLLLAAEKARNEVPGSAAKIDEWAAPFREHFEKLLNGYSLINGAWVSNAELARQAREKRQAAFLSSLDYQIGADPFPGGAVRSLVAIPLAVAGLALAAGAALLAFGRKRTYLVGAGAALLAAAPLAVAAAFFLATRDPALLPLSIPMADGQPVVEILSQAAGLQDSSPTTSKISEAELNGFLARHVRLAAPARENGSANIRQSVAIRLLPGGLAVFEMIRSRGLDWMVRIDLEARQADGKTALALAGAKIGALDCPAAFAAELWKNLEPQFSAILSASRVGERFAIQNPGDGTIELKALANPAAVAP